MQTDGEMLKTCHQQLKILGTAIIYLSFGPTIIVCLLFLFLKEA